MFIYFWERERAWAWAGEGQGERETQNPKQAPGSELSAQSPMQGSNSQTMRSWPEPRSGAQPTEPPGRPYRLLSTESKLVVARGEVEEGTDEYPMVYPLNELALSNEKESISDIKSSMHGSQTLPCVKDAGHKKTPTDHAMYYFILYDLKERQS